MVWRSLKLSQWCNVVSGDFLVKPREMTEKIKRIVTLSTDPDAFDASPCDLLTVIELNALQPMAAFEVLQGHVGDEGAVIQFHHRQTLLATSTAAQGSDAIVCDQLTVWQRLQGQQQAG